MAVTAWLKRFAPEEVEALVTESSAAAPDPWSTEGDRDLFIDKIELEVLGSLYHLHAMGQVPEWLDVNILESEPLDDWRVVMGRGQVAAVLARIPPLERWVAEHFDPRSLGTVYPAKVRPWWDGAEVGGSVGEQVAATLRDLAVFLAAADAAGEVVVISIG